MPGGLNKIKRGCCKTSLAKEKPKRILHSKKKSSVLKSQEPDKMHGARKKIRKTGRKTKTIPLRQLSGFNRRLIWRKCGQILRPRGILPRDWRAGRLLHDRRPRHDRRHDARHRHMEGPRRLQHGGIPPRSCRSSTSTASPGKRSCTERFNHRGRFPDMEPSFSF